MVGKKKHEKNKRENIFLRQSTLRVKENLIIETDFPLCLIVKIILVLGLLFVNKFYK